MTGLLSFVIITASNTSNSLSGTITKGNGEKIIPDNTRYLEAKLTGTTGPGDVAIELKPHEPTGNELAVDYSINTHSVDLSQYDLTRITTLEYEGKTINPLPSQKLQGHHNSGTMIFPIEKNPGNFVIKISGIPKIEERIFEWRIEK